MTTLDIAIANGNDDAFRSQDDTVGGLGNAFCRADSNAAIGSRFTTGLRFQNVTIPPGSTIDAAYVTVEGVSTAVDDPNVNIHCEASDNALDFATGSAASLRSLTTAFTQWTATGIGTGRTNSPSIVAAIQEVINRAGWASGNALMVLMVGRSDAASQLRVDSYELAPEQAAAVHIEYTAPAGGKLLPEQFGMNVLTSGIR